MNFPDFHVRKAYIRCQEKGRPVTSSTYDAMDGLVQLGVEPEPFYGLEDFPEDYGPEVMIVGYVGDILTALSRRGFPFPPDINYPIQLVSCLRRMVWKTTLGEVRRKGETVFVKPVEEKVFTGLVWDNTELARRKIVTQGDDVEVWASEPVTFVTEYRCYVLEGSVVDVRRYKGLWSAAPDKDVVEAMVALYDDAPVAYSLDVGVDSEGRTTLVEINDAYALGNYGVNNVVYARILMARWEQLFGR